MNQFAIAIATNTGFVFEFAMLSLALMFHTYRTDRRFNQKNLKKVLITLVAAGAFRMIGEVVKLGIAEPRPCWNPNFPSLIACPNSFSFPSGHALGSMMVAVLLGLVTKKRLVWIAGVFLALVIAWSRVAVGVHTVMDVSLAAIFGALFGWIAWRVYWHGH